METSWNFLFRLPFQDRPVPSEIGEDTDNKSGFPKLVIPPWVFFSMVPIQVQALLLSDVLDVHFAFFSSGPPWEMKKFNPPWPDVLFADRQQPKRLFETSKIEQSRNQARFQENTNKGDILVEILRNQAPKVHHRSLSSLNKKCTAILSGFPKVSKSCRAIVYVYFDNSDDKDSAAAVFLRLSGLSMSHLNVGKLLEMPMMSV